MKIEFNERGFAYAEFEDRYKQKCSIQKSSLATEDCIWLGVDVGIPIELGGDGKKIMGRMHLTQEMAAELIPILQRFVNTGELTNKRFDEAMSNADIKERLKVIAARMNAERDEAKEWAEARMNEIKKEFILSLIVKWSEDSYAFGGDLGVRIYGGGKKWRVYRAGMVKLFEGTLEECKNYIAGCF